MTKETFSQAINNIDDKFIEKTINHKGGNNMKFLRYGSIAAALVVVVAAVVFFGKPLVSKLSPDEDYGKGGDYQNTATVPVTIEGDCYTDEQIKQYVERNKSTIAFTVAAEYGCADEIKVMIKGYNHASLGEKNIVKRDLLSLPILQNNKIVAEMVIFTADGEMTNTINIGGEIWNNLNDAFNENPDSELVMAYSGGVCEVVITPDNRIYEINQGGKDFLSDGVDWYSLLKTDYNTFSLKQFDDPDNFIVISDVGVPDTVQNPENTVTTPPNSNNETTTVTSVTVSSNKMTDAHIAGGDITKITVIAEFREQMGATPITVPDSMLSSFIENISNLKLIATNEPEGFTGGGYVATVYNKNGESTRYVFLNETIVELNGNYYNETSGGGKMIVDDIISLLK